VYKDVTKNLEPGNPFCNTSWWQRAHGCLLPARRTETVPREKDWSRPPALLARFTGEVAKLVFCAGAELSGEWLRVYSAESPFPKSCAS